MLATAVWAGLAGLTPPGQAQINPGKSARRTRGATPTFKESGQAKGNSASRSSGPADSELATCSPMRNTRNALADVEQRDERDLRPVDVLAGKVDAPNAPIPHWRGYETDSRRTSLVVDPPDGRLPARPLRR